MVLYFLMLISISKYTFLATFFIFIHYLLVNIAFLLFFTLEIETHINPRLKKKTIDLLLKVNILTKKNMYEHFNKKKVFYFISKTPFLEINNFLFFNTTSVIGIPKLFYIEKKKEYIPSCITKLRYDQINKTLLEEIATIIFTSKELFLSTPDIYLEKENKIIFEDAEKKIIAYPWQKIHINSLREYCGKKEKKGKKIIDIRPHYKKNYEI